MQLCCYCRRRTRWSRCTLTTPSASHLPSYSTCPTVTHSTSGSMTAQRPISSGSVTSSDSSGCIYRVLAGFSTSRLIRGQCRVFAIPVIYDMFHIYMFVLCWFIREDMYSIMAEKFELDVAYILERERQWVGQNVVARDDKTGTFALGTKLHCLSAIMATRIITLAHRNQGLIKCVHTM